MVLCSEPVDQNLACLDRCDQRMLCSDLVDYLIRFKAESPTKISVQKKTVGTMSTDRIVALNFFQSCKIAIYLF